MSGGGEIKSVDLVPFMDLHDLEHIAEEIAVKSRSISALRSVGAGGARFFRAAGK